MSAELKWKHRTEASQSERETIVLLLICPLSPRDWRGSPSLVSLPPPGSGPRTHSGTQRDTCSVLTSTTTPAPPAPSSPPPPPSPAPHHHLDLHFPFYILFSSPVTFLLGEEGTKPCKYITDQAGFNPEFHILKSNSKQISFNNSLSSQWTAECRM